MGDSKIISQQIAHDLRRIRLKVRQQEQQRAKEERNASPKTPTIPPR